MSTITLKAQISALLTTVEDERFLQSITAMLQAYVADEPVTLTSEENAAIEKGLQDMKAGRVISHQQVKQPGPLSYAKSEGMEIVWTQEAEQDYYTQIGVLLAQSPKS